MSQDLKQRFEQDGYIVEEGLFSEEEMSTAKEEIRKVLSEAKHLQGPKNNGVFVGLVQRSAFFKTFESDPRLVDLLQQTVGPHIEFLSDKVVLKSAEVDFGSPWHQDWPYWRGNHKISFWIALDGATPENGCLKVVPGSHKKFVDHKGDSSDGVGFGNRIDSSQIDESRAVDLIAPAGTVVLFHDLLFHSSYPNRSGRDRWALIPTYRDASEEDQEGVNRWPGAFMVSGKRTENLAQTT